MMHPPAPLARLAAIALAALAVVPAAACARGEAESLSSSFRKAARRVLPAVVTVRPVEPAVRVGPVEIGPAELAAGGSGVVIDAARGLVLTNDHVVGGGRVVVTLPDGRERPALDVRRDPRSDLALVRIAPDGLTAAEWGDAEALEIGDWVLAVGQPFGLSGTVTAGIVSGKGRAINQVQYEDLVQTDAAINPGNSGGPLVDLNGRVVGINTALKSAGGGYEGVGFAVPAGRARRVADDLARFGRVRRAQIGVRIGPRAPGAGPGVPILAVGPLGPAAQAGIRPGDVIVQVGDRAIQSTGMLQGAVEAAPAGEPLAVTVRRGDQTLEVQVRPAPLAEPGEVIESAPLIEPAPSAPPPADSPAAPPPRR